MQFRFPTPIHGWRAFSGEVGIIVVGVLLALGGQQIVDSIQSQREVAEFRAAVDDELGYGVWAVRYRLEQSQCLRKRLDQLDAWLGEWKAGTTPILLNKISRPVYILPRTSVWQSRTDDVAAEMGLSKCLAYAQMYDRLSGEQSNTRRESDIWNEMQEFSRAETLDATQRMRLGGLIDRARGYDGFARENYRAIANTARALGIEAVPDPQLGTWDRSFCEPLKWKPV